MLGYPLGELNLMGEEQRVRINSLGYFLYFLYLRLVAQCKDNALN